MSDDQRAAGAESHPETESACPHCDGTGKKPAKPKNPFTLPVFPDGRAATLADGWAEGAPTTLPLRGALTIDLRPQLLVQETRYLGREIKKEEKSDESSIRGIRELACYMTGWNLTFTFGPAKGMPMPWPDYDPYQVNAIQRETHIRKRLEVLDNISTDDVSVAIERLQWLRWEVAQRYEVPPVASDAATTTSTPSGSAAA